MLRRVAALSQLNSSAAVAAPVARVRAAPVPHFWCPFFLTAKFCFMLRAQRAASRSATVAAAAVAPAQSSWPTGLSSPWQAAAVVLQHMLAALEVRPMLKPLTALATAPTSPVEAVAAAVRVALEVRAPSRHCMLQIAEAFESVVMADSLRSIQSCLEAQAGRTAASQET